MPVPMTVMRPSSALAWIERVERWIGGAVETAAAILLVLETGLLFAGVVARYAFLRPIVWSDELAGSIFLWLSMFGAVIALRRGEHMCFVGLTERIGPRMRAGIQSFVLTCSGALLLLLLLPARDYVEDESFAVPPNLGVPSSWRVFAIEVGLVLMLATVLLQIVRRASWRAGLVSVLLILATGTGLWLLAPGLMAIGNLNLLVFFVLLIGAAIAVGVPIGFAFGLATVAYLGLVTSVPLNVVVNRLDQGMSQPLLLAIPLFIFLGLLIDVAGWRAP